MRAAALCLLAMWLGLGLAAEPETVNSHGGGLSYEVGDWNASVTIDWNQRTEVSKVLYGIFFEEVMMGSDGEVTNLF